MSPRLVGAVLSGIAAILVAVSIVASAMWAGHPTVNEHVVQDKTVYIGLLTAEGCNTGGDGRCQDIELSPEFKIASYIQLGSSALVIILGLLLSVLAFKKQEARRLVARFGTVLAAICGGVAVAQYVIGPHIKSAHMVTVPIGYGMHVFLAGLGAMVLGSLLAPWRDRPPRPKKVKVPKPPKVKKVKVKKEKPVPVPPPLPNPAIAPGPVIAAPQINVLGILDANPTTGLTPRASSGPLFNASLYAPSDGKDGRLPTSSPIAAQINAIGGISPSTRPDTSIDPPAPSPPPPRGKGVTAPPPPPFKKPPTTPNATVSPPKPTGPILPTPGTDDERTDTTAVPLTEAELAAAAAAEAAAKLPMGRTDLPPPINAKVIEGAAPAPKCPRCQAAMVWTEEHLQFYCTGCRMYF